MTGAGNGVPHATTPMSAPAYLLGTRLDLTLSATHYRRVAEALHELAGIRLGPNKKALVIARLGPRVRLLSVPTLEDYVDGVLHDELPDEWPHFIDALTTNKSGFFREPAHFTHLQQEVFPALERAGRPLRFWSAACAAGEEPYTLAMVVRDTLSPAAQQQTRILATDLSHRVLDVARAARYSPTQRDGVSAAQLARHFEEAPPEEATRRVNAAARDLVRIAWLNLVGEWPIRGPFDVILCRNVMIYFDRPTQHRLVARLGALLAPGGTLCVGHTESLAGVAAGLELVQPSIYRRPGGGL